MEALAGQIRSLTEEVSSLRNEIVNIKAAHASLHQASTDSHTATQGVLTDHGIRIGGIEGKITGLTGGGKQKSLIDIKNVVVGKFAGSLTDGRAKYLEWCEQVRDRCDLYDRSLAKAFAEVANKSEEITEEESRKLGVGDQASAEYKAS